MTSSLSKRNDAKEKTMTTMVPFDTISTQAIQPQVHTLWATLSAKETTDALGNALKVLWNLVIQIVTLLSLLFLLFAVVIVWFWGICYQSGRAFKEVFVTENAQLGGAQIVNGIARLLMVPAHGLISWVRYQVKAQFGQNLNVIFPGLESQVWKVPSEKVPSEKEALGKGVADSTATASQISTTQIPITESVANQRE